MFLFFLNAEIRSFFKAKKGHFTLSCCAFKTLESALICQKKTKKTSWQKSEKKPVESKKPVMITLP